VHAVRHAIRSRELDENTTLLIGADSAGRLLEVVVADIDTERAERFLDALDPVAAESENTEDLRAVAVAADTLAADEARLTEAVEMARARGRSWSRIGIALGVSRQAARQRFADKTAV
jgi:hypothetical protein